MQRAHVALRPLSAYPREWLTPGRLAEWERGHVDPCGGVWAVYLNENTQRWEVNPPGTPNPKTWPYGEDPYEPCGPMATFDESYLDFDLRGELGWPLTVDQQRAMAWHVLSFSVHDLVSRVHSIQGLRWLDETRTRAVPVLYARA